MNKLIGVSGKRGAGKGTFCTILEKLLPGAISRQFGYELKLAAAIITGEPIDTFLSQQGKSKILPEFGITAGKFLVKYTDYPYMHFDIAGPAFIPAKDGYRPKGGTGTGVRLFFDFFKNL